MSNVPMARDRIEALIEMFEAEGRPGVVLELRIIKSLLYRERYRRRSDPNSNPMTPELRWQIYDYAMAHPEMSNQEIGNVFGVNPGRVSETLRMAGEGVDD